MDNLHLAAHFNSNFEAWYSDHVSHLQSSNKDELKFAYQVGAVLGVVTRSINEAGATVVQGKQIKKPYTKFDQEMQIESQITRIDFAFNRMDNVAIDIVGWMPKEDNEEHHNAVEMLQRARQELLKVQEYLREQITALYER